MRRLLRHTTATSATTYARACSAAAVTTPVLISGAGPAGLVTALALARAGERCVLVEPRARPSTHPRAHVLTARTVEICESLGLGDELTNVAPPPETWRHFRYCDAVDGADFGAADHGAAPAWANLLDASEARVAHVSQPVFETLLREAVAEEPLVETRYGRRVATLDVSDDRALATLDDDSTVAARRVVAADGVRGAARLAVVAKAKRERRQTDRAPGQSHLDAAPALQHFVSVAFESRELADRLRDRPAMLYFVFNAATVAVVVAHDFRKGIFNLQVPFFPPAERPGDAAAPVAVRNAVAALTTTPLRDVAISSARPWLMRARLDDFFACSDVGFLAGDAAHEMPPSGGLGLNTAVGDAHNLAWKLALANRGGVDAAALLATYETERRPVL